MDITVVVPTHHEEQNIPPLLRSIARVMESIGASHEVLVVDVGSKDGTTRVAAEHGARVHQQTEPGYGGALREGFRLAQGDYVVTMDADLSHDPTFIRDMWALRHEADTVVASRYVPGGKAEMPLFRYVLSRILNVTWSWILSLPLKDISSGFRMYRRSILPGLHLSSRDFDVLEEILMKVYAEGYTVKEIPLAYAPRQAGRSHARLLGFARSYARTLYAMWRLRNSLFSADYDERAFNSIILPQRYWQRARFRIIMDMLSRCRGRVLDIGCGSSRIIQNLPDAVAVDILLKKLRFLRKMGKPLVTADVNALPFASHSFDTVVCSQVIEHIPVDARIFQELARVTRPGGCLILGTPDYGRAVWRGTEWVYGKVMPGAYADEHISHYTREGLLATIEEAGFCPQEHRYVGGGELIVRAIRTDAPPPSALPSLARVRTIVPPRRTRR